LEKIFDDEDLFDAEGEEDDEHTKQLLKQRTERERQKWLEVCFE
jgi:hypothetical protein